MALRTFENQEVTGVVPTFQFEFDRLVIAIGPDRLRHVLRHVDGLVARNVEGARIQAAGWLPAGDWRGSALEPVRAAAARVTTAAGARSLSVRFVGQLVALAFMRRPERWVCILTDGAAPDWTYYRDQPAAEEPAVRGDPP